LGGGPGGRPARVRQTAGAAGGGAWGAGLGGGGRLRPTTRGLQKKGGAHGCWPGRGRGARPLQTRIGVGGGGGGAATLKSPRARSGRDVHGTLARGAFDLARGQRGPGATEVEFSLGQSGGGQKDPARAGRAGRTEGRISGGTKKGLGRAPGQRTGLGGGWPGSGRNVISVGARARGPRVTGPVATARRGGEPPALARPKTRRGAGGPGTAWGSPRVVLGLPGKLSGKGDRPEKGGRGAPNLFGNPAQVGRGLPFRALRGGAAPLRPREKGPWLDPWKGGPLLRPRVRSHLRRRARGGANRGGLEPFGGADGSFTGGGGERAFRDWARKPDQPRRLEMISPRAILKGFEGLYHK